MYHSDSTAGIIEAWDFDAHTGALADHRVLATLTNEEGRPDGAAVDVEGDYWSAGPSAGCVNRFSPQGALLSKLPFPVPGPTMPCFAERHLYVTSLREGRSPEALQQHPTLGGLFRNSRVAQYSAAVKVYIMWSRTTNYRTLVKLFVMLYRNGRS